MTQCAAAQQPLLLAVIAGSTCLPAHVHSKQRSRCGLSHTRVSYSMAGLSILECCGTQHSTSVWVL